VTTVLVVGIVVLEELSNYAIECRIVEIAGTHIDSNRAMSSYVWYSSQLLTTMNTILSLLEELGFGTNEAIYECK
jgi:hypothetical protein